MPAKTLEELKAVVEALVDDGILKRRKRYAPGSCAFLTTELVDDALKAQDARRQGAAAAKQFRQRKAASAQRARQQGAKAKAKAKAKADADAHARLAAAASVDPVFVSEEAMPRDYGPVGAAAQAAVPQVQYVPVVVTQQGLMAVMPYGAVPLGGYVAY